MIPGPIVLSLFDRSGAWPRPYADVGARVITVDLLPALPGTLYSGREHMECDVREVGKWIAPACGVAIVLAAPPCDHFAGSGAQYWAEKDVDGRTAEAVALVRDTLGLIRSLRPRAWALENPVGRLRKLVPEVGPVRLQWDPCDYGDPYTKRTQLFGNFNAALTRSPVEPERSCSQGSWLMRLGGKSEKTKTLRSTTPSGFARAFCSANPPDRAPGPDLFAAGAL